MAGKAKAPKVVYPEQPASKTQLSDDWMKAYMRDKGTAEQLDEYVEKLPDESSYHQRREIFCEVFKWETPKKAAVKAKSFKDEVIAMAKAKKEQGK